MHACETSHIIAHTPHSTTRGCGGSKPPPPPQQPHMMQPVPVGAIGQQMQVPVQRMQMQQQIPVQMQQYPQQVQQYPQMQMQMPQVPMQQVQGPVGQKIARLGSLEVSQWLREARGIIFPARNAQNGGTATHLVTFLIFHHFC